MRVSQEDDDNSRLVKSADWVWQDAISFLKSHTRRSTRCDPSSYESPVLRQMLPSSEVSQKYL
jgi:hypothetical protein